MQRCPPTCDDLCQLSAPAALCLLQLLCAGLKLLEVNIEYTHTQHGSPIIDVDLRAAHISTHSNENERVVMATAPSGPIDILTPQNISRVDFFSLLLAPPPTGLYLL